MWLSADHTRLAQVIGNLLNNAAKYTPAGGTVSLSVRCEATHAEIVVADTGIGIPFEMQSRIFTIFEQVEDHRARAQGGLGIGLALVKQLVALHGGTIAVESAGPGKGSAFTVRMPLASDVADTPGDDATGMARVD